MTNKLCGRPPQYAPPPCKLTFDLLSLKVVSESRVTWATSVPILVFLGLCSRLRLDVRDRQTDVRRASSINDPTLGAGHNKQRQEQRHLSALTYFPEYSGNGRSPADSMGGAIRPRPPPSVSMGFAPPPSRHGILHV